MSVMESITNLFGENVMARYTSAKDRKTERGEFLKRFAQKTGRTIPFIAFKLTGIETQDLYFIEKQCDAYNGPWSKAFFGMLRVKPKPTDF